MKRLGKIAVCLAGGLALNAGLRAADAASANTLSPDDPYAVIATRNAFGLVAPAPPPDPSLAAEKSLPKITPTGIMTVFGHSQVLFKVAPVAGKPGPGAKEDYYILSQGQRQDDIEVTKIDEKNGLVTFDNHGTTQELPLVSPPASGPAAPASPGGMNPGILPNAPGGFGNNVPNGFTRFGAAPGVANGLPNGNIPGPNGNAGGSPNGGPNGGPNFGNSVAPTQIYQPEASTLTPEQSQVILVTQHFKAIKDHDPSAQLFPPSAIDSQVGIPSNTEPPAQ
jgi:hypothetical protein